MQQTYHWDKQDVFSSENSYLTFTLLLPNITGSCDKSFYPIFNRRFDDLETLLTTQETFVRWVIVRAFSAQSSV